MKAKPPTLISPGLRRRFLIRLAMALHSYGSSASRTEYLIDKAADKLDIDASISVFPSLILISFPGVDLNDPQQKEIHMINVEPDLDVDKLGRADELGLLIAKIALPSALFGSTDRSKSTSKNTLPYDLAHDKPEEAITSSSDSDSEEDMAI